jgi:hypothetical protein
MVGFWESPEVGLEFDEILPLSRLRRLLPELSCALKLLLTRRLEDSRADITIRSEEADLFLLLQQSVKYNALVLAGRASAFPNLWVWGVPGEPK